MKTAASFFLLIFTLTLSGCDGDTEFTPPPVGGQVIHVALDGFISNPGTAAEPVLTLDRALDLVREGQGQTIKVAAGVYSAVGNQRWDITGGVDIIGGCDRTTWEPVTGSYSEIQLFQRPIKALDIRVPTRISGLHLIQRLTGSPTSNTLYLFGCSEDLVFSACRFTAASGGTGNDGNPGNDGYFESDRVDGQPGQPGTCTGDTAAEGGLGGNFLCNGGMGGSGGRPNQTGQTGADGHCQGAPGGPGGSPGADGLPGQDGVAGENGKGGAIPSGIGYFQGTSFLPFESLEGSVGTRGSTGGGGGGGGGSATGTGNGGGGGGSPGSGGGGGRGANGGGHSIAMICLSSTAIFQDCHFTAGKAGSGGRGGDGGAGSEGGLGAPGAEACPGEVGRGGRGGDGGSGGNGGGGGGGNGGSSIAVFLSGIAAPAFDDWCTMQAGAPGSGGAGGLAGDGSSQAQAGHPGLAIDLLNELERQIPDLVSPPAGKAEKLIAGSPDSR